MISGTYEIQAALTDSNLKAPPTQALTSRLRRRRCWARHRSPRGGVQGLSPWLGPGRDASTQRATPTGKPPSRPAFPGHAAQPEAPPATATRWTQPWPGRSLQLDRIPQTGQTLVFDTGPVLRSSKSAGGGSVPNPAGAAGVLRSEHPRALQGSPALGSGFQELAVGLRPGNGGSSSRRIQSTPVSPLALRDHSGRSDATRSGGKTLPACGNPQRY